MNGPEEHGLRISFTKVVGPFIQGLGHPCLVRIVEDEKPINTLFTELLNGLVCIDFIADLPSVFIEPLPNRLMEPIGPEVNMGIKKLHLMGISCPCAAVKPQHFCGQVDRRPMYVSLASLPLTATPVLAGAPLWWNRLSQVSRNLVDSAHVASTYTRPAPVSTHELEVRLDRLLSSGCIETELQARLHQSSAEKLSVGTDPDYRVLEEATQLSEKTSGRWQAANYTRPLRYASLWRWLYERSPLRGRHDLKVFGVGIGAQLAFYPDAPHRLEEENDVAYDLYFAEPLELLAVAARCGEVRYIEMKESIIQRAREFRESGVMISPQVAGPGGYLNELRDRFRRREWFEYQLRELPMRKLLTYFNHVDVDWAMKEIKRGGVHFKRHSPDDTGFIPLLQLNYPVEMARRLTAEAGDLLFYQGSAGWADFSLALYALRYLAPEPGPLTVLGTLQLARTVRRGGLIAVSDFPYSGGALEDFVLRALGFTPVHALVPMEPHHVIHIYRRPFQDSVSATRAYQQAAHIVAELAPPPEEA